MKAEITNLVRELTESGVRLDPDDPRFDAKRAREVLAVEGVDVPTVDGLVWVSVNADGTLAALDVDTDTLRRDEREIAANITAAIKQAERIIDEALTIVRARQRKDGRGES
ncbi:YbaB/EbfC family nucleoid-associated protein [Stackebrandtia nassauensis]|uniref:YbaB/EbfC DNA-binding family protein n=1 Tax=Stackebrandtia nassauensis (strain DSM 44728 / CIP 108903 / NRRL B-16338 / NBRC 102104 / LLR-40K-21) TaxID=446470 RepID=D3Q625_STANL|nr:YbaB/EbfC family nucleoid-associated protein [Stackebrandtia nassauensis]ADD42200.1 hypothetical protein Snas_2518 [Stackebrandtia nassauensis DSM 44728]